jgi:GH15 family glucan-1,4-alpha-glucosidase
MQEPYKSISSYGVVGNLETCALIGKDGSVDWLCFPYIESPSIFGALLDVERGGRFSISPTMNYESTHTYLDKTNILQTHFIMPTGEAVLTDFMPVKHKAVTADHKLLIRKVDGTTGVALMRIFVQPRFQYAHDSSVISIKDDGVLMRGKNEWLFLLAPSRCVWKIKDNGAEAIIEVRQGQTWWFVLQYNDRHAMDADECAALFEKVNDYWQGWVNKYVHLRGKFDEPFLAVVMRSGLVLKLLINTDLGAISSAVTTSLPEEAGGIRNWDYRFAWLRDSSFTMQSLYHLGDIEELAGYTRWVERIVKKARCAANIDILYGLHPKSKTREDILDNFSGYRQSGPVRLGNAAVGQLQLDIYGELINAIYTITKYQKAVSDELWKIIKDIVDYVCFAWTKPDNGIWEIRGEPRDFVHSKLMCWVALDRGVKIAWMKKEAAVIPLWKKTRQQIRNAILKYGFDAERNTFVQSFGSKALDELRC